jgi:hypothetical protein
LAVEIVSLPFGRYLHYFCRDFEFDFLSGADGDGSSLGKVIPVSKFSTISAGLISFTGPNNAGIILGTATVKLKFPKPRKGEQAPPKK